MELAGVLSKVEVTSLILLLLLQLSLQFALLGFAMIEWR